MAVIMVTLHAHYSNFSERLVTDCCLSGLLLSQSMLTCIWLMSQILKTKKSNFLAHMMMHTS